MRKRRDSVRAKAGQSNSALWHGWWPCSLVFDPRQRHLIRSGRDPYWHTHKRTLQSHSEGANSRGLGGKWMLVLQHSSQRGCAYSQFATTHSASGWPRNPQSPRPAERLYAAAVFRDGSYVVTGTSPFVKSGIKKQMSIDRSLVQNFLHNVHPVKLSR